jgi:type IV secretion system protein TrbE
MVALRRFRATGPSFADLVPYAGLVEDGVLLLKDGSLMAGWYFAGPDAESATDFERNELSRQINTILSRLGSGWIIQVEAVRIPTVDYPSEDRCFFPDAVTRAIDAERRAPSAFRTGTGSFREPACSCSDLSAARGEKDGVEQIHLFGRGEPEEILR